MGWGWYMESPARWFVVGGDGIAILVFVIMSHRWIGMIVCFQLE